MSEKDYLGAGSKDEAKKKNAGQKKSKVVKDKTVLESDKISKKDESNKNKLYREFKIQIPRKEIEEKFEQAVKKYSSEMKIDGFRKGKIPSGVVKSKYNDAIMDEIVNKTIEEYTFKVIKKEKIPIISSPVVKDLNFKDGKDLKALVSVDLYPEVIIPDLDKITVSIKKDVIKTEEYDEKRQIDLILQSKKNRQIVKDRCIKDDDFVEFKIQSQFVDTKRMMPKEDSFFEVKSEKHNEFGDIYQDFIGKCKSDKFELEKEYKKDFHRKKWAGKKIKHFVEIKNIFEYITPKFDVEFLESAGFKDEKSFKSKLKEEFDMQANRHKDQVVTGEIREKLIEVCNFAIPDSIVDQEVQRTQSQYNQEVKKKNGIEIKNDDLEKEYKIIAEANSIDVKDVRKYYMNKEQKESLKDGIGRNMVIDLLKEKIKIKEV